MIKLNKIRSNKFFEALYPDVIIWTIIILLFVFAVDWNPETLREDVREVLINFIPYTVAIYVNFAVFKFFLLKKKYLLFIVSTIVVYTSFTYLIQWIRDNYNPGRNDDILFSILLFSFFYIGIRYLITSPREILKIKNLENKRIQAERDLQEMEAKHSKAELEVLKSQLNPHFLFNSLNNIYSLTIVDPEKAGESILTLSDLMRYNLESSKKKNVTLRQEIEFINNYIELEKLRISDISEIKYKTKGDFETRKIAPMILISFVENCFKHGISSDSKQNNIEISIELNDNTLFFSSNNSIAATRIDVNKKDVSVGIENVKRRLELLYKDKYELEINSENGTYTVNLKIEL
jgi:two-component system LytT family sensor kinase